MNYDVELSASIAIWLKNNPQRFLDDLQDRLVGYFKYQENLISIRAGKNEEKVVYINILNNSLSEISSVLEHCGDIVKSIRELEIIHSFKADEIWAIVRLFDNDFIQLTINPGIMKLYANLDCGVSIENRS